MAGTATQASLDERYGRRPRRRNSRRLLVGVLVAFVVVAGAWLVWSAVSLGRSSLTWQDRGSDASDPAAVEVTFAVRAAAGTQVVCAVRATDARDRVVGWLDVPVTVPASGRAILTATVPTSEAATGGGVAACTRR